jgi:hypothetical protein
MEFDKRIGQRLADKSAVGCDKSAPTVGPWEFVDVYYRARDLAALAGWIGA